MSKTKASVKFMKDYFEGQPILHIGYSDLSTLLRFHSPIFYNCGVYGWNFDAYEVNGVAIITGYRNTFGKSVNYDLVREYEMKARKIEMGNRSYEEWKNDFEVLLNEFLEKATHREIQKRYTIAEVKEINNENGYCFFSKDSMKFFGTKVESTVYPNNTFITSDFTDFERNKRGFTVRKFDPKTGSIDTVGKFNGFHFIEDAREFAKNYKEF